MKKKLFTLLLAAAGLSIFQANADSWIRVDRSGLAKHVSQPNPFPKNKSGFDSWLSVKGDTVYVRSQKSSNADSSEIVTDEHSEFNVESAGSTRFKISSKSGVSLKAKWDDIEVSSFEIVQFDEAGKKVGQSISDSIEGYPVFLFPGSKNTADNAVLAGADKEGTISFRAFSEFAVHADSVPASPCLSYQFTEEKKKGRLYQSDSYPFFQIYHEQDSALVATGGERINWSERRKPETPESQNPIYSYYEFKYVNDSISINDSTVHLETIVNYVKSHTYEYQTDRYGISEGDSLSGIDTATVGNKNDSLLYFRVQDGLITFTALAADGSWTNEEPTRLKYEGQDVWYYIDATDTTKAFFAMKQVLIKLFGFEYNYFVPDSNQVERYIYKNDADWHPLYIKAVSVKQPQPYEYVTEEWLNDHEFNFTSATQYIFGGDNKAISTSATVSTAANAARLKFEPAARIDADSTISGLTGTTFAGGNIELFHIKNDNQYLTVDTTAYTATNTKLIWDNKIASSEGADTLRQAFAIVHNKKDSIFTFLPVASRQYPVTDGSLRYNLGIGEKSKDDIGNDLSFEISNAWYINLRTDLTSNNLELIITSDINYGDPIWLKLDVTLDYWGGPECGDRFAVIYKNDSTHYSASGIFANEKDASLADSIRSHWLITPGSTEESKHALKVFTPRIGTIYGVAQNKTLTDTVLAHWLPNKKGIELIRINNVDGPRDTIQKVECINDPYTLPFRKFDSDSVNVAILASGTEYNLSKDNDGNAVLKPITESDTFRVVLHRSNVQTLAAGLDVPYYIFSTADSLFLKANTVTESVQWVKPESDEITLLLDDTNESEDCAQYKFCLPYKGGVENEDVYLQTLHSTQTQPGDYGLVVNGSVLFGLNASKFESVLNQTNNYVAGEGIYSAIDQYNSHIKPIASWKIVPAGEDPGQGTGLRKVGSPAKIYGAAGEVRVIGASGAVSVYSIDGRPVWAGAVVSPNQTIAVSAGIYIVKNGVHVVKVVVK